MEPGELTVIQGQGRQSSSLERSMKTGNLLLLSTLLPYCSAAHPDQQSALRSLLEAALEDHLPEAGLRRERRQVQAADPGAVMYLPLGGSSNVRFSFISNTLTGLFSPLFLMQVSNSGRRCGRQHYPGKSGRQISFSRLHLIFR